MSTKALFGILLAAFFIVTGLTACDDDEKFIENAKIQEEGQTLSPGEVIHLKGKGYLKSDEVMLNFYWETGKADFPEGYLKAYRAEILSYTQDEITIRMPYRKPESRVEILLMRNGKMMMIGEVRLKDGTTPKDARLYGINNIYRKGGQIDALQIMRCKYDPNAAYEMTSWPLEEHSDFHSVVGVWGSYGLCGLAKREGVEYPFFFDFCTSEWKQLSNLKTIALFGFQGMVGALQTTDGEKYEINFISNELEKCDYATAKTKSSAGLHRRFPLPEELKPEHFGEYPGAYTNELYVLFSANKGNGKWALVVFDFQHGFYVLNEIEADKLIPFSVCLSAEENIAKQKWVTGYIVARKGAENDSELYLLKENASELKEPFAVFPNYAVSASANEKKPGTLTVHFEADRNGNVTREYLWETKEWKSVNGLMGHCHDEIIWTN